MSEQTYTARIRFSDVREITVTAESEEEAQRKFDAGEWDDESSVDFYAEETVRPLARTTQGA